MVFVDPVLATALSAEEFLAHFAIVTDILKVELASTTLLAFALCCCKSLLDQGAGLLVCCQIKGSVTARVGHGDIATATHEAFEDAERFGI